MLPFATRARGPQTRQKLRAKEVKRLHLIETAELPQDEKLSILVPKQLQDNLVFSTPYGANLYCLLLNNASTESMESSKHIPAVTFVHVSGIEVYPVTELLETHRVFGLEADADANTVVVGHLKNANSDNLICIDVYSVNSDFSITLVHAITTDTHCAGENLCCTFSSPNIGEYTVLWGDLTKDDFFDTFTVATISGSDANIETHLVRTKLKYFNLKFQHLGELYPAANNTVFYCHTRGVENETLDCISLTVYHADLTYFQKPSVLFHTVIKLPYPIYRELQRFYYGKGPRISATIQRMKQKEDGSIVCLVRIMTKVEIPRTLNCSLDADGNKVYPAFYPRQAAYKEKYVYLLFSMSHRSILDMCVPAGAAERCTIDVTGQCIVRFKDGPDGDKADDSEKDDSAYDRSPLVRVHNFYKHLM